MTTLANDLPGPPPAAAGIRGAGALVRLALVGWILLRVAFFTGLWLGVLFVAYIGYFTFSLLFLLVALGIMAATGGFPTFRRWFGRARRR